MVEEVGGAFVGAEGVLVLAEMVERIDLVYVDLSSVSFAITRTKWNTRCTLISRGRGSFPGPAHSVTSKQPLDPQ